MLVALQIELYSIAISKLAAAVSAGHTSFLQTGTPSNRHSILLRGRRVEHPVREETVPKHWSFSLHKVRVKNTPGDGKSVNHHQRTIVCSGIQPAFQE